MYNINVKIVALNKFVYILPLYSFCLVWFFKGICVLWKHREESWCLHLRLKSVLFIYCMMYTIKCHSMDKDIYKIPPQLKIFFWNRGGRTLDDFDMGTYLYLYSLSPGMMISIFTFVTDFSNISNDFKEYCKILN